MVEPPSMTKHDSALARAVREVEAHAHDDGWDRPPQLFALVPTDELLAREPALGAQLGLDAGSAAGTLTPVQQEQLPPDRPFEETLTQVMWPPEVVGCVAVLERVALPPEAEAEVPDEPTEAQEYAASHPDRQEVRMAAGVSRHGNRHCVLRVRTHDGALVQGPDIVPTLTSLLLDTLRD
ncbi:MAG: PPA1309 family protein [Nocardioidaceae bacterium]